MTASSLPEPFAKGLNALAALSDTEFEAFLAALRSLPTEIKQHRIFPDFDVPNQPDNGEALKSAAFAILMTKVRRHTSVEVTVSELFSAIAAALKLSKDTLAKLRERVVAILGIANLALVAKAYDVLVEHSCTYSSARIVSDIRTIFGDDITAPPQGAVIVHMLNIVYHSAGKRQSQSLALDEKDIDQLIGVLERAKSKTKALRDMIAKTGSTYIGVK